MRRILVCCLLVGCGDDGERYPPGSLPTCESFCERKATSPGGCAGDLEECPAECETWRRDNADAGCEASFDDVLYCTGGTTEVCEAIGGSGSCGQAYSSWRNCLSLCDAVASVGDVTFDPACETTPCTSGTVLTMSYPGPLPCTTRVELSCSGGTAIGYLPRSAGVSTGTITLACTAQSGCGQYNETATYYSSGSSSVICTP
jgi:hypothetical protein